MGLWLGVEAEASSEEVEVAWLGVAEEAWSKAWLVAQAPADGKPSLVGWCERRGTPSR